MKLNRPFNCLSLAEYRHIIRHHKRYVDFNPLDLYRSILENPKLDMDARQEVLALANEYFGAFYAFLVVKDLPTYARLSRLGEPALSQEQEWQYIRSLERRAQKIRRAKKIRHRRVGVYTKSSRVAAYDEEKRDFIDVEVMTKRPSQKQRRRTAVAHAYARKHKQQQLRALLPNNGEDD